MENAVFTQQDQVVMEPKKTALNEMLKLGRLVFFSQSELIFESEDITKSIVLILKGEVNTFKYDDVLQMESEYRTYLVGQVLSGLTDSASDEKKYARANEATTLCIIDYPIAGELLAGEHIQSKHLFELVRNTLVHQISAPLPDSSFTARSSVIDAILQRAKNSQVTLQNISELELDDVIMDIADSVNRQAWTLAQQAISETGMGRLEHRVQKIMLGSLEVAASLKGKSGVGNLTVEAGGIEQMPMPMGVVLGLIPITNPIETLVFKVLISLKSRNAIVLSCHRDAKNVSRVAVDIIRSTLKRYSICEDIVQLPNLPVSRSVTQLLMRHRDMNFILATGGESVVQESYRSGTPSIGVGKGNAPVWVRKDANLTSAAQMIVSSKAFDNGVVCGSENNLIIDSDVRQAFADALIDERAAILSVPEVIRLQEALFDEQGIQRRWLGKPACELAKQAGITRPYVIELLVCPVVKEDLSNPFIREKLAPIVSMISVDCDTDAIFTAQTILDIEGRGHTAIIHSQDRQAIEAYTRAVDVSRVLVNSPGTQGCIGACNGLQLSWTLGCGTGGGGSTSDNVGYEHLMNKKRLAFGHSG